jgi:hypothetical protein
MGGFVSFIKEAEAGRGGLTQPLPFLFSYFLNVYSTMDHVPNLDNMYGTFLVNLIPSITSPRFPRFGVAYIGVVVAAA